MCVQADTYVSVFECVYPTIVQWNSEANENYNEKWKPTSKGKGREQETRREQNKAKAKANAYFLEHVWAKNPTEIKQS